MFQWDFQQLEDDLLNMHHGEECDDKELLLLYFLKHCQYCLINNWEIHFFTCKMKITFSWSRKCYICQFKHNIFSLFLTFNFDWNCVINLFLFHVHYFHQVKSFIELASFNRILKHCFHKSPFKHKTQNQINNKNQQIIVNCCCNGINAKSWNWKCVTVSFVLCFCEC